MEISPCLLEFEPIAILCGHRFSRANWRQHLTCKRDTVYYVSRSVISNSL